MSEPSLLVTKFTIPPLRAHLLPRAVLIERLNQNVTLPLVLLSAGAGFGKTTLLAAWANQCPYPIAWLTLDSLDNDPLRFWSAVLATLRIRFPTVGEEVLTLLHSPQPPRLSALLTLLINELAAFEEEVVLILDDYHVIEEQAIHESLVFLLDHVPPCLHLVISSRVDPGLPLSRWRVRGQLAEIRDTNLRLNEVEVGSFLGEVMGVQLRKEEEVLLAVRTEGWIAGLQLAALSLQRYADPTDFVKAFSGSQRFILDYVQEEILAGQSLVVQQFLMLTAVLNRMNAALCQAVTGEQACQMLLETLERANLFLIPLDGERRWYRLHDLFREAMLARLHTAQPEMVSVLHQRAACWYEAEKEWHEAISHWLSAADFPSAARLMEQTAEQFWLDGEAATMSRWVMELPDVVVRKHVRLVLNSALYLLLANYLSIEAQWYKAYNYAEQLMMRVELALRQLGEDTVLLPATEVRQLKQRLRVLRAWSGSLEPLMRGDREQFRFIFQQMQNLEGEDNVAWQMIPFTVTFIFYYAFEREEALLVPRLEGVWQRVSQSGDHFAMIEIRRGLVLAYLGAGRLRQAHQLCLEALTLLEQVKKPTIQVGYFQMGLAVVLYEWNRLEETQSVVQKVIHNAAIWHHVDLLTWGYRLLVKVEIAAGKLTAAHQALQEAERLAHEVSAFQESLIMSIRVLWWLAVGNLAEAGDWAAHVVFHEDAWKPYRSEEFLALIRVYLAQQRYTQAVETLERFSTYLDRPGNIEITIDFLSLSVVALHQAGMSMQARVVTARLLTLTESEGYIRVYLDAGDPMREVLQSFLEIPPDDEQQSMVAVSRLYITALLAAFEQDEHRSALRADALPTCPPAVLPPVSLPLPGPVSSAPSLTEPLTPQEQRVLLLLAEGASNQQIANRLVISLATVKKHVTNLLGKLGAANRTQAIVRAREYGLL